MKRTTVQVFLFLFCFPLFSLELFGQTYPVKKILIVVEGSTDLKNYAMGDGRQLAELMGHFSTAVTIQGVNQYISNELNRFDYTFYIGFSAHNSAPVRFMQDVYATSKPVIWLGTGFAEFSRQFDLKRKFGFSVSGIDSSANFDMVRYGSEIFTKGEPNTEIAHIKNRKLATIIATTYSSTTKKETPYIVRSKNLLFFADSPFSEATENDRYLLFADMLHDILHEQHPESHNAIIRIEDVDVLEDPDKLRQIADILSSRGIPFLVGVIPYYVDPGEGIRLSLSDKPDFVDALQYIVKNGGTIVMHGVTHQYKGVTAVDYEFWDSNTNKPIKDETADADARRLEMGIQECMKNGIYPLVWETPHYTASFTLYKTVAKYFSTVCEQRLSIEDADYSQYFPYVINKDLFGQTIYPENLGYVPLDSDKVRSRKYVENIIRNAKTNLYVRDGYASVFFHPFLDLDLLKQLVDGIQGLGYTFVDLREKTNWVKTKDRVILSGSQSYTVNLNDQYLSETYFDASGEITNKIISDKRIKGPITKTIVLGPDEFYKAEPTEFRERPVSLATKIVTRAEKIYNNFFPADENWQPARVALLWNHYAQGASYNDQASFASVFQSVNIRVDTFFLGQQLDLSKYNLLIVPYAYVDSMKKEDYDVITDFVQNGGNLITDMKNDLAEEVGISFVKTKIRVGRIRDTYFPEEPIVWRYPELVSKFETGDVDKVFCTDEISDAPVVIGKKFGNGKVIFIGSHFDPRSQHGYSLYPYLLEYVREYFHLRPFIRREKLEVYFDPGFRHSYSIEQLVKQWVDEGIRVVHVAGWHEYPKYTYDYARMIRLAHANGILVYAWLEPPQVSQKFWNDHPEWREKNYKGEDIRPSWRYPVAMTDPQCLAAMADNYEKLLTEFDWDGVNIAELYFDAGRGLEDPKYFTPMHPSARTEFKRRFGIDLVSVFDPNSPTFWRNNPQIENEIVNYRVEKLDAVYDLLLSRFNAIAQKKEGFQIIVTAMDGLGSPELRQNLGVDIDSVIARQKRYGFLLQIEDPASKWSTDPFRYVDIGRKYSEVVGDKHKLLLDLNILSFRKKDAVTPFPTQIQTGTESFQLIRAAALGASRSTIYSEASVNPQDMGLFANALAAEVQYTLLDDGYQISAPYSLTLKMPADVKEISVDGVLQSSFRNNRFTIPSGTHVIHVGSGTSNSFSTHELQTRIMGMTGTLLTESFGLRTVSFEYESHRRTLVSFSNIPTAVAVDGAEYAFNVMKGNDCYTIFLPPGNHSVEVVTGDQFSYGINVTSLWSTTAIAMFGSGAVSALFLMYLSLKFTKRNGVRRTSAP
jgi:uncharacterized protein YdaL